MSLRAAIVGTGGIARVHATLIQLLGGTIVGVCGRTLASARAFGIAEPYTDLSLLLREQKPDVVHICSPNHLHAEQAMLAFQHGAHVVCEKPLATSLSEASRMIEAAERARRVGAVCFSYRGYPVVEELRERVRTGAFGALRRIAGAYLCEDSFEPNRYMWHFTPGSVGPAYALMDVGVHWFDLAEHVTGQRISQISAQFATHTPRRVWSGGPGEGPEPPGRRLPDGRIEVTTELEEQADLLVRFDGGAGGAVTVSTAAVGCANTINLNVDGSLLGFDWNQENPNFYCERSKEGVLIRQRRPQQLPPERRWMSALPQGQPEGYLDAFRNVILQAWQAMQGGSDPFPSFADGARSLQIVEAAVRSHCEGKPMDVSLN